MGIRGRSCPDLSWPGLAGPGLTWPGLSCPVLSCPVLTCPVLSCPVQSGLVLSCPVHINLREFALCNCRHPGDMSVLVRAALRYVGSASTGATGSAAVLRLKPWMSEPDFTKNNSVSDTELELFGGFRCRARGKCFHFTSRAAPLAGIYPEDPRTLPRRSRSVP